MKRWMILALTVFAFIAVFGESLRDVKKQVEIWINKEYKETPVTLEDAIKDFKKICNDDSLTDEEKIAALRKGFPDAFPSQSLIFQPPLSWRIHSLALGYDIKESAEAQVQTVDILSALEKLERERSSISDTTTTTTRDRGWSATGELSGEAGAKLKGRFGIHANLSFNPFKWLKGDADVGTRSSLETEADAGIRLKGSLKGYYSYGKKTVDENRELWSARQQATFSREHQSIAKWLQQTKITNRHLSFTVTLTNNSGELMECDVREAYLPIYTGNETCGRAKPLDRKVYRIEPGISQDIFFRMELDTTKALSLVDFMSSASPTIELLRGNMPITSPSYPNGVISASLRNVETRPFDIRLPGFAAHWEIRRRHAAAARETTLRDALIAADEDIFTGIGYHICKWGGNNELTALSEVPLGKFAPNDSAKSYLVFIRLGSRVVSELSAGELDSPLPASGCTLWIVDLEKLEDYKDSSSLLGKAIFAKVKAEAEKGDALAQFRVALMLANGFGTTQNLPEAVEWYRRAAAKELPEAQFALGVCYGTGKGVEKDPKEATEWFRKAAAKELPEAQFALGVCYYNDEKYKEAVEWFHRAADQGHTEAQFKLGECFANGKGVEKNLDEAAKWYRRAAKSGDKRAAEALQRLQSTKDTSPVSSPSIFDEPVIQTSRTKDTSPVSSPSPSVVEPRPQGKVSISPYIIPALVSLILL